jgi:beta-glucosidase
MSPILRTPLAVAILACGCHHASQPSPDAGDVRPQDPPVAFFDLSGLDRQLLNPRPAPAGLDAAKSRAAEIMARMSQDEKLRLVRGIEGKYVGNVAATAGLPAVTLQDGPAGVARFWDVTAFPAPITLAASWNRDLVQRWGAAMAAEERGKGAMVQLGPMMNMVRSPTAGRNFESFGEDPFLASELVAADVTGMQSQKVVATAKHFVGNEQETNRGSGDSQIDERTLHEIYYPPFEAAVNAGVGAVMCSYNRVGGAYACENPATLGDLKSGMGFTGWVMSDWGATHSTVAAANAGLDMEMPDSTFFGAVLASAVAAGTVPQARLDDMVGRILVSLLRIGVLDDPPTGTPDAVVASAEHSALAREAAAAGVTLLKNRDNALPLDATVKSIAVIGSAGGDAPFFDGGGSAYVNPRKLVSPLAALQAQAGTQVSITYARGDGDGGNQAQAVAAAATSDAAIVFAAADSTEGEDRGSPSLRTDSDALIAAVAAANPRTIVVLHVPGAVLMPWIEQVEAVLVAFYPGEENGNAVAPILLGAENPSGKLPVTFPHKMADLPQVSGEQTVPYREGLAVGYRALDAQGISPLFPFGHGLSYTTFAFAALDVHPGTAAGTIAVDFTVTNTGDRAGTEVAQLYLGFPASADEPPWVLRGFTRVTLAAGESRNMTIELSPRDLSCWTPKTHARYIPSGTYQIAVGSSSRDLPLRASVQVRGLDA